MDWDELLAPAHLLKLDEDAALQARRQDGFNRNCMLCFIALEKESVHQSEHICATYFNAYPSNSLSPRKSKGL